LATSTIASSVREISIEPDTFVFGEIGLSGEVRAVAQAEARLKEAAKIGFKRAVIPAGNALKTTNKEGLQVIGIRDVEEFLEAVLH